MSTDKPIPNVETLVFFWENAHLIYIIPNNGSEFPEGFGVFEVLSLLIKPDMEVVEIGCYYGRLCQAFTPEKYKGVDINTAAIAHGKTRFLYYILN